MASRRKTPNSEDLNKLQQIFEDDFGSEQDLTSKTWVRGDVIQRGNVEKLDTTTEVNTRGATYRPGQQVLITKVTANHHIMLECPCIFA